MKSPVLFVIFCRENTTRQVFERIREAKPPRLYVAADGPRQNRIDEKTKCEATRKIIEGVDWKCDVKTLFHDNNLGCGRGVSTAISWFFENEEQGIILEDDILPNIEFFKYCDEMLDRYKYNENIQLITGFNFFFDGYPSQYSYYMSHFLQIWGWASWRRVWQTYEYDSKKLQREEFLKKLKDNFSRPVYRYYKNIFDMMSEYKNDTWDYQFFFNQTIYERFSIIPFSNLVENIGFGSADSSHPTDTKNVFIRQLTNHKSHPIYPLKHPEIIFRDPEADKIYASLAHYKNRCFIYRAISKTLNFFTHSKKTIFL